MNVLYVSVHQENELRFDSSRTLIFPVKDYHLRDIFRQKSMNQNYVNHDEKQ